MSSGAPVRMTLLAAFCHLRIGEYRSHYREMLIRLLNTLEYGLGSNAGIKRMSAGQQRATYTYRNIYI